MISIIIRTKNEERWITECLSRIYAQDYKDIEVIVVDNNSTDKTIVKAAKYPVKIVKIDKFIPGKAINEGIKASKGEYIVCLSAHCLPVNNQWLDNLLKGFTGENIAGVYGRQEPMSYSSDFDKRDLLIAFGLDRRVQVQDSFFHNANSMIRRDLWEKFPFDEKLTNIEDRAWAKAVQQQGYKIVYEPEARVYHFHGIHQTGNLERCSGVVKVLHTIDSFSHKAEEQEFLSKIAEKNVAVFIPVKGQMQQLSGRPLIEYTIDHAKQSKYIKDIFVLTDNPEIKQTAENLGARVPFLRKAKEHESLDQILKESLEKIEEQGYYPDIVAVLWPTFPFRDNQYIDQLIEKLVVMGLDSVISVRPLFETCWQEVQSGKLVRIDSGNVPRQDRKRMFVGIEGLGYVTYPDCMRRQEIYKEENLGVVEVLNPISAIKVRDPEDFELAELIAQRWFNNVNTR